MRNTFYARWECIPMLMSKSKAQKLTVSNSKKKYCSTTSKIEKFCARPCCTTNICSTRMQPQTACLRQNSPKAFSKWREIAWGSKQNEIAEQATRTVCFWRTCRTIRIRSTISKELHCVKARQCLYLRVYVTCLKLKTLLLYMRVTAFDLAYILR